MLRLELLFVAIVVLNLVVLARRGPSPGRVLGRYAALAAAGWVCETSCIRLYGFYSYDAAWWPFVDVTPLLVPLIWPIVILSAWQLAGALAPRRRLRAATALVLSDAALIEPIAVASGLWRWHAPGLFGVPPIGIAGWALFAGLALAWLERSERRGPAADWALLLVVPPLLHAGLLAGWWGALRWVSWPLPDAVVALTAAGIALGLSIAVVTRRPRVPRWLLTSRAPAALVFYGLLIVRAGGQRWLCLYAVAFALPYAGLTLLARPGTGNRPLRQPDLRDDRPAG